MKDAELERAAREVLEPLRSPSVVMPMEGSRAEEKALTERLAEVVRGVPLARRRRRSRLWATYAGLALAAAIVLGLASASVLAKRDVDSDHAAQTGSDTAVLMSGALSVNGRPLERGQRVHGVLELATTRESARLATHAGVTLDVDAHTHANLNPSRQQPHVELMSGGVTFDVPPLPKGSTLRVVTPDATVTVIGTRFTVTHRSEGTDPGTCVSVVEGVVQVTPRDGVSRRLHAGSSFGCDALHSTPDQGQRSAFEVEGPRKPAPAGQARSTLGQENRLLRDALAAERRGDRRTAERKLSALLGRYPNSPLAGEARSQLARIRSFDR